MSLLYHFADFAIYVESYKSLDLYSMNLSQSKAKK